LARDSGFGGRFWFKGDIFNETLRRKEKSLDPGNKNSFLIYQGFWNFIKVARMMSIILYDIPYTS